MSYLISGSGQDSSCFTQALKRTPATLGMLFFEHIILLIGMMNSMASPCGLLDGFLREQQIDLFESLACGLEPC